MKTPHRTTPPPAGPSPDRFERINRLVERVRSGRSGAWDELYALYRDASLEFCARVLGDRDLAEDALQEGFLEASRRLDRLRSPEAFTVWFRRILIKQCDRIRRSAQGVALLESDSPDRTVETGVANHPVAHLEHSELSARIAEAIEALPEPERTLCTEYYLERRDQREIGRRTGLPLHTIKNRLYRARRILRTRLDAFRPMAMAC